MFRTCCCEVTSESTYCALRRRRAVLVEVVELVERLVAQRLQVGERPGGVRQRRLERERGDDRAAPRPPKRQGLRRRRRAHADGLRLDRAQARRELLGEERREHLVRRRRAHELEDLRLLRVHRRVRHQVPEHGAVEDGLAEASPTAPPPCAAVPGS